MESAGGSSGASAPVAAPQALTQAGHAGGDAMPAAQQCRPLCCTPPQSPESAPVATPWPLQSESAVQLAPGDSGPGPASGGASLVVLAALALAVLFSVLDRPSRYTIGSWGAVV